MKLIRFCWYNYADLSTTTLTYSSQNPNFPASNIQHRWHTRHWRSTDDTSEWLKWDLGSAKDIDAFLLKYNNFTAGATIKIQANTIDSWAAPAYESTLVVDNDIMYDLPSTTKTYRWWRLSMVDASNPDTILKVGRVFLCSYDLPDKNFDRKYKIKLRDPSLLTQSEGGQISSIKRTKYKAWGYAFGEVSKTTKIKFEEIWDALGTTGNMFVIQDADDVPASISYCRFIKDIDVKHIIMDDKFNIVISVEELR